MKSPPSIKTNYYQIGILIVVTLLSLALGYRLGEIKTNNDISVNLAVNKLTAGNPTEEKINTALEALARQGVDLKLDTQSDNSRNEKLPENCQFIASRKSHKLHTADCKYGKKIKKENLICFSNIEEARQQGYLPAKGCLGDQNK